MINTQRLTNPAEPLLTFGEALGISLDIWVKREELEQITYTESNLSQENTKKLTLDLITALRDAYGDALACRFRLGDLPVLDINLDTDDKSLEKFYDHIQDSPTVGFEFTLNKTRLVENWLGSVHGHRIFLYLFSFYIKLRPDIPSGRTLYKTRGCESCFFKGEA